MGALLSEMQPGLQETRYSRVGSFDCNRKVVQVQLTGQMSLLGTFWHIFYAHIHCLKR